MQKVKYDVPLIKQGLQECAQTSAVQILNYYGNKMTVAEFKEQVPLYISKTGEPLGSSIGHIGKFLIDLGYQVTIHVVELEIFDPSWSDLSTSELVARLRKRRKYIKHHRYDAEAMDLIFDGYAQFFSAGGAITFPVISKEFLIQLLQAGPIYAVVNWNFLNQISKGKYLPEENEYERNAVEGFTSTHVVVIAGYDSDKFYLVDPDYHFYGGKRWVDASLLIGSIYLAETDLDSMVISIQPKS